MSGELTPITTAEEKRERERKEKIQKAARMLRESYLALIEQGFSHEDAMQMAWSEE